MKSALRGRYQRSADGRIGSSFEGHSWPFLGDGWLAIRILKPFIAFHSNRYPVAGRCVIGGAGWGGVQGSGFGVGFGMAGIRMKGVVKR
jgi:hypothetical protein